MHRNVFMLVAMASIVSCTPSESYSSLDAPKKLFAQQKVGTSADFGIIKFKNPNDHVVSVHGFADDESSCKEIVDALNTNACKDSGGLQCVKPYSCIPLNSER